MTQTTLKTINVQGKDYKYIQYPDNTSSVMGLVVPITNEARVKMLDVGGFYRDIMEPLSKDESVREIVILSVTERGMRKFIGFFFNNGKTIEVSWVGEYKIEQHYAKYLEREKVPYEFINSLEYLQNNPKEEYLSVLENYVDPISVEDTGIHLDGEIIPYGATVIIQDVQKMVEKHPSLAEGTLARLGVDTMELEINEKGLGLYNTVGSGTLYRKDGTIITCEEDYYYSYHPKENNETYEEYVKQAEIERVQYHAEKANQRFKRGRFSRERIMAECLEGIERDTEDVKAPLGEMVGLNFLLSAIEMGLVTKEGEGTR